MNQAADAAPPPPLLPEGTPVGGRFRVTRFIARGGMGEIYEAEDLDLGERIALKVIKPELAADPEFMARFRAEVLLSRRVTHPNVCRIYDLGRHDGPDGAFAFLTMELLPGIPFVNHLDEVGRFSPAAAWPLARQMAAALQAAHAAGIIHGDFTPMNMLLIPRPQGDRLVVTDFGLARAEAAPHEIGEEVYGTPAFMAPEQLRGLPLSPATDIYAFGLILYGMLSGSEPLRGNSAAGTLTRRLREDAPPISTRVEGLDPRWEALLARCLSREPSERYPHGGALLAALEAITPALAGDRRRRTLAVLGFRNHSLSAETAWLATALAEMLGTELAAGGLRLVPGETVARVCADLALAPGGGGLSAETLERVRARCGAELTLQGGYLAGGAGEDGPRRVDLLVQDGGGQILHRESLTGGEDGLLGLIDRAGQGLRTALGLAALTPADSRSLAAIRPASAAALRLYAEGLDLLRGYDALAARRAFERAAESDPGNPLILAALAEAWMQLGHEPKAREAADAAAGRAAVLTPDERDWVEGRRLEIHRDWAGAAARYRALIDRRPDAIEPGLRLASVLTSAGKGGEALEALQRLREASDTAGVDPRLDIEEALSADAVSDSGRALASARRALERAHESGARLVIATAQWAEGYVLFTRGEYREAAAALTSAQRAYLGAGDRRGVVRCQLRLADLRWAQGDNEGAAQLLHDSLRTARELGDRAAEIRALNLLAIIADMSGDLDGSRTRFEEVAAIAREIGSRNGEAVAFNNLGENHRRRGELTEAAICYRRALDLYGGMGDRRGMARALDGLGHALLASGNPGGARAQFEAKLDHAAAAGDRSSYAHGLHGLGLSALVAGHLDEARTRLSAAIALREELGERGLAAESRLGLAECEAADADWARADRLAQLAAEEFAAENRTAEEAAADALRVRIAIARDDPAAATRLAAALGGEAPTGLDARVAIGLARAAVAGLASPAAEREAQERLLAEIPRECRLLRWRVEWAGAHPSREAGKASRARLRAEAEAAGCGLFARDRGPVARR